MRLLVLPAALLLTAAGPPEPGEVAKLVARLGSPDYHEREAATRRLEDLGPAALAELRAACRSDDPEVARRALGLFRMAERRAASDKLLAPTLVELDATDRPLDAVLADLSRQAGWAVVLGGAKPEDLAGKRVTVSTGGKVPFWGAVLKVCGAADLRIAGADGFVAPGSAPDVGRAGRGARVAADTRRAVVLEARGGAKPRPAAVYGAVLVEAVPLAATGDGPAALLQAWPEPRLSWEATTGVKVVRATDPAGGRLVAAPPPGRPGELAGGGMVLVRNPDGSASLVRDTGAAFELAGAVRPNARQAVVRLGPGEKGGPPPREAKELAVTLLGAVRSGIEPVCGAGGLKSSTPATATGPGGTEVSMTFGPDGGSGLCASVQISYDPTEVRLAGAGEDLPGARGAAGPGNATVHGLRVTDADGRPYTLGLDTGLTRPDPTGRRATVILKLQLQPGKGVGPPDAFTLWGSYLKPVTADAVLKDVPLAGGR